MILDGSLADHAWSYGDRMLDNMGSSSCTVCSSIVPTLWPVNMILDGSLADQASLYDDRALDDVGSS